ncbi:MAG: DUF488 domain-containing protein [Chloroflexia bacterium]
MPEKQIFTIGHSNHALEDFLQLVALHQIEVLADVRSAPYSKYTTQFNAPALKEAVLAAGLRYVYLGAELGGRPKGPEFYDAEGHALYSLVAESPLFLSGIERLETGIAEYRVAVMCSEEDPSGCHRHLLVGRVLARRGITVLHIRGDGRVQTDADLAAEAAARDPHADQPTLFDLEEATPWRSIRSVLPKSQPPTSSEH